jgi:anti-sigma regulatory factor (Ser/Thr protein kinase)
MFKVENKLYGMQLVSEEILMNWIQHGNHESKNKIEFIWLNSLDNVILEVVDSSSAFNPLESSTSSKSSGEIGGLGLQFIRSVTQEQRYLRENDTNRLCLTFN